MTMNTTLLECYGCGLTGSYEVFNIPTKCPRCGSFEIHLPEAHDNWKKGGGRK